MRSRPLRDVLFEPVRAMTRPGPRVYNDDPNKDIGRGAWRDTGCALAPSCLACPLPYCKEENPGSIRQLRVAERDTLIRSEVLNDIPIDSIAEHWQLTPRTIYRIARRR